MAANTPINDDLSLRLRTIVSNAYAFVKGRETTQSFSAITFEDLAQAQIDRLSGKGTATRPNVIARIKGIEDQLLSFANQIKQTDPSAFLMADSTQDVNTPAVPSATTT